MNETPEGEFNSPEKNLSNEERLILSIKERFRKDLDQEVEHVKEGSTDKPFSFTEGVIKELKRGVLDPIDNDVKKYKLIWECSRELEEEMEKCKATNWKEKILIDAKKLQARIEEVKNGNSEIIKEMQKIAKETTEERITDLVEKKDYEQAYEVARDWEKVEREIIEKETEKDSKEQKESLEILEKQTKKMIMQIPEISNK